MNTKKITMNQAKHIMGKAMCQTLGIPVVLTKTGKLTVKTARELTKRGYYWFPGERVWKKLG